ncbi:threonine synthase ['Cynodon dactylon' phytoplasma]|nr:threonine synthase ['Cynodon dactylon' phytoplasma]
MFREHLPHIYHRTNEEIQKAYQLESFKDSEIKKEILTFFEKRKDPEYPKNLVIEKYNSLGISSLCDSIMKKFNLKKNHSAGIISRLFFTRSHYNNEADVNMFFQKANKIYEAKLLEKILDRKDFIIKPLYEDIREIKMENKINIFISDLYPFLHGLKNKKIIDYIKKNCKFINCESEKYRNIDKLYIV